MQNKLILGIPAYNRLIRQECCDMTDKIVAHYGCDRRITDGTNVALNRNYLICEDRNEIKQKFDFDYFLSIDGDNWCDNPIEVIEALLAHSVPIVTAGFPYRKTWLDCYVGGKFKSCELPIITRRVPLDFKDTIECDWTGLGFTLIKREVFEAMRYPYFRELVIEQEEKACIASEDIGFFSRAGMLGYRPLMDCRFTIYHKAIGL